MREEVRTAASCQNQRIFEDKVGHGSVGQKKKDRKRGECAENRGAIAPPLTAPHVTSFERLLNEVQNDRHVGPMLWQRGGISGIKNRWWKAQRGASGRGGVWISPMQGERSADDLAVWRDLVGEGR